MHRNIARAYDYLRLEDGRIREACIAILSQRDEDIRRQLLRANLDDPKHHDEMLLYEERLARPQRRRVLDWNRYGKNTERIMDALLRL